MKTETKKRRRGRPFGTTKEQTKKMIHLCVDQYVLDFLKTTNNKRLAIEYAVEKFYKIDKTEFEEAEKT